MFKLGDCVITTDRRRFGIIEEIASEHYTVRYIRASPIDPQRMNLFHRHWIIYPLKNTGEDFNWIKME